MIARQSAKSFCLLLLASCFLVPTGCNVEQPQPESKPKNDPPSRSSQVITIELQQTNMLEQLQRQRFASNLPIKVDPNGTIANMRGNLKVPLEFHIVCKDGGHPVLPRLNTGLYKDLRSNVWKLRNEVILQLLSEAAEACSN